MLSVCLFVLPKASLQERLREAVLSTYESWSDRLSVDESRSVQPPAAFMVSVKTWREQLRDLIGPVEKERELMRILFSIVYLVCAGLVLSIFWAIVYEKTRDIGIMRSVGASRPGILSIFLTYGLVIGLAGAVPGNAAGLVRGQQHQHHPRRTRATGSGLAVIIPSRIAVAVIAALATIIMAFRDSMLKTLLAAIGTIVLAGIGAALYNHSGFLMWDPSVYYFNEIPNSVDWFSAILTMAGAVVFSVLGAAIPAARAADTDPVQSPSLRMNDFNRVNLPAPPTVILEAKNLKKTYRLGRIPVPVLHDASITVKEHEWVAILGTHPVPARARFLHLLGGLDRTRPKQWHRQLQKHHGLDPSPSKAQPLPQFSSIGFVFQFYHLLPELSVLENALLAGLIPATRGRALLPLLAAIIGLLLGGACGWFFGPDFLPAADQLTNSRRIMLLITWAVVGAAIGVAAFQILQIPLEKSRLNHGAGAIATQKLLKDFGLDHRLRHRPSQLSGGERQRTAIARALANSPDVLLADEPTGNLDAATGREILELLKRRHEAGLTIVMVTHDPVVAQYADRVVHLEDGRVVDSMPNEYRQDRLKPVKSSCPRSACRHGTCADDRGHRLHGNRRGDA